MKDEEHQHQVAVIKWFDLQYPSLRGRLYASPNGGHRYKSVAVKLKAEGVRSGIPDLTLPVPNGGYHGMFIEMKTPKGRVTDTQKDWIDFLNAYGYYAVVCFGSDQARAEIKAYLER